MNTIFVLGAGASVPYGLPTGWDLRTKILDRIFNTPAEEYQNLGFSRRDRETFGQAFSDSNVNTIDFFLSQPGNEQFRDIGKLAISLEIAALENYDKLMGTLDHASGNFSYDVGQKDFSTCWYNVLWQNIERDLTKFSKNQRFSFITFNYDRSLEQFLYSSFKGLNFGAKLTEVQVQNYLATFTIIHVHGHLGPLPWLTCAPPGESLGYGEGMSLGNVLKLKHLSKNLKIISESNEKDESIIRARNLLTSDPDATIIFLGFGFHEENLRRLGLCDERLKKTGITMYTTKKNLSESAKVRASKMIGRGFEPYQTQTCSELLIELL